jgi:hypothetical protein
MRIINNYTANLVRHGSPLGQGNIPLATDNPASVICYSYITRTFFRWWPGTGQVEKLEDVWPLVVETYLAKLAGGDRQILADYFEVPADRVDQWMAGDLPGKDEALRIESILRDRRKEGI